MKPYIVDISLKITGHPGSIDVEYEGKINPYSLACGIVCITSPLAADIDITDWGQLIINSTYGVKCSNELVKVYLILNWIVSGWVVATLLK